MNNWKKTSNYVLASRAVSYALLEFLAQLERLAENTYMQ